MTRPEDLDALRELTLHKVGRNCVNFARMESCLRFIASQATLSAPASDVAAVLAKQVKKHKKAGMGTLADVAAEVLHSPASPPPENLTVPWYRFEVSLADGGSSRNEWRRVMRGVVRERNQLLHRRLAEWDSDSVESCRELCAELDAQRERMREPHEHLRSLVRGILEARSEAAQALRSQSGLE